MFKIFVALAGALMLTGCCELFGICSSVSVHTSISPSYEVAQSDSFPMEKTLADTSNESRPAATGCLVSQR